MRRVDLGPPFLRTAANERRAADVGYRGRLLARGEPMSDLDNLPLAVAEHEQVRARVERDRAAHLFLPIVVMRDPAQARFDAADHDRGARERLAHTLRIHDHTAIGPL